MSQKGPAMSCCHSGWDQWVTHGCTANGDDAGVSSVKPRQEPHWQRYDRTGAEIEAINERLNEIAEAVTLPDPRTRPEPDSACWFTEGTLRLKADKAYAEIGEEK